MIHSRNPLARFFGVILNGQTYLNLLYLLLVLPLGILYFVFFTAGVALGVALSILLVGLLILALVAFGWWAIASFERHLAIWLLRVDVPPMEKPGPKRQGWFGAVLDWIGNPTTWKSLIFILLKMPLGIFVFTILVALATTSIGLAISPLIYNWFPVQFSLFGNVSGSIDTLPEALIAFVIGILLGFASLHIFNYLAYALGLWAKVMLGNPSPEEVAARPELPLQPVAPVAAVVEAPQFEAEEALDEGEPQPPSFYEPEPETEATPPHGTPAVEQGEAPPGMDVGSQLMEEDLPAEIQDDAPPEFLRPDEEDTDKLLPPDRVPPRKPAG